MAQGPAKSRARTFLGIDTPRRRWCWVDGIWIAMVIVWVAIAFVSAALQAVLASVIAFGAALVLLFRHVGPKAAADR